MDKILFTFTVLWEAWESDSEAWVKERADGTRYVVMTNHGSEYISSVEELEERLQFYHTVEDSTAKAIGLIKGTTKKE